MLQSMVPTSPVSYLPKSCLLGNWHRLDPNPALSSAKAVLYRLPLPSTLELAHQWPVPSVARAAQGSWRGASCAVKVTLGKVAQT